MKHKHAEVIKAWVDGAIIEYRTLEINGKWSIWYQVNEPAFYTTDDFEYRIKPTNDKQSFFVYDKHNKQFVEYEKGKKGDLLVTFDGKTGKLKQAEVIQ
jgi:hypothetical protein